MSKTGELASLKNRNVPWKELIIIALIYALAVGVMTSGYLFQLTAFAGSLKRTQIFWTALIATLVFNEAYASNRLIGASIITIGTILIALSSA
mgnify:CR=1 FL=1